MSQDIENTYNRIEEKIVSFFRHRSHAHKEIYTSIIYLLMIRVIVSIFFALYSVELNARKSTNLAFDLIFVLIAILFFAWARLPDSWKEKSKAIWFNPILRRLARSLLEVAGIAAIMLLIVYLFDGETLTNQPIFTKIGYAALGRAILRLIVYLPIFLTLRLISVRWQKRLYWLSEVIGFFDSNRTITNIAKSFIYLSMTFLIVLATGLWIVPTVSAEKFTQVSNELFILFIIPTWAVLIGWRTLKTALQRGTIINLFSPVGWFITTFIILLTLFYWHDVIAWLYTQTSIIQQLDTWLL